MSSRPTIGIGWGTELWLNWAWIALDQRDEARAAREADGAPTNNRELQASNTGRLAAWKSKVYLRRPRLQSEARR